MSACPFCFKTMRATFTDGLAREKCVRCASLWFEGEALAEVMGDTAVGALMRRAQGKSGECKGCHAALPPGVEACPECERSAPTCPRCHRAPLALADVAGVKVDTCTECHGVGLDPGELEQLMDAAEAAQPAVRELPSRAPAPTPRREPPKCAECGRKVRLDYAFVWAGKLYCSSCAPEGASPYDRELARTTSGLESTVGLTAAEEAGMTSSDPISFAVKWFFSKL